MKKIEYNPKKDKGKFARTMDIPPLEAIVYPNQGKLAKSEKPVVKKR